MGTDLGTELTSAIARLPRLEEWSARALTNLIDADWGGNEHVIGECVHANRSDVRMCIHVEIHTDSPPEINIIIASLDIDGGVANDLVQLYDVPVDRIAHVLIQWASDPLV